MTPSFLSPVSKFNASQEEARQEQQQRMNSISTVHTSHNNKAKRKQNSIEDELEFNPNDTISEEQFMSSNKRLRQTPLTTDHFDSPSLNSSLFNSTHDYLQSKYDKLTDTPTSRKLKAELAASKARMLNVNNTISLTEAMERSRTYQKEIPSIRMVNSFLNKGIYENSAYPLQTPTSRVLSHGNAWNHQKSPNSRYDDYLASPTPSRVVDLSSTPDISALETVEGQDILHTMLRTGDTPRSARKFPSEQRQREYVKDDPQMFVARRRLNLGEIDETPSRVSDDDVVSNIADLPIYKAPTVKLQDEDKTVEPIEEKISNWRHAQRMNWKFALLWLATGSIILCTIIVSTPYLASINTSGPVYCSNIKSSSTSASNALQVISLNETKCVPCPIGGKCFGGKLVECETPLELQYDACVENEKAGEDLHELSNAIQVYMSDRASAQTCGDSFWESTPGFFDSFIRLTNFFKGNWESPINTNLNFDYHEEFSPIIIRLSELKDFLLAHNAQPSSVEKLMEQALSILTAQNILHHESNTSQQIVLHNHGQQQLLPWHCQARHQLIGYGKLLLIAIVGSLILGLTYRKWNLRKAERQLVDRLIKEVRFFLLTHSSVASNSNSFSTSKVITKHYPADHLRENLFDTLPISALDRKWLRDSVWPRVVALIGDDPRVRSDKKFIHGKEVLVWEWISSSSSIPQSVQHRTKSGRTPAERRLLRQSL